MKTPSTEEVAQKAIAGKVYGLHAQNKHLFLYSFIPFFLYSFAFLSNAIYNPVQSQSH